MADALTMTTSLQCFAEGKVSQGSIVTLVILTLQIVFGLVMRRRSRFPGRRYFLIANAGLAYWLALATLEQWTVDGGCKVWFAALTYVGIALVPLSWIMFIHRYAFGRQGPIPWRNRIVLVSLPTAATLMALTSPWHGLFYAEGTGLANVGLGATMVYVHGPLFWASSTLLYGLLVGSVVILLQGLLAARSTYRLHFALLLLLTLAPMIANIAYVYSGFSLFGFDPTPFFFIVTSMTYALIIVTNSHLDLVSIARKDFFEAFPTAIAVVDTAGRVQFMNRAANALIPAPEIGMMLNGSISLALENGNDKFETRATTSSGRAVRVVMHAVLSPLGRQPRPIGWMAVIEDVTAVQEVIAGLTATLQEQSTQLEETREQSEKLQSLAFHDPLTNALNRRGLEASLTSVLTEGASPKLIAVGLLDIDHFKQINDRYGHEAGDTVLVRLASILIGVFRRSDLVFRIGGEEFLVLGPELDSDTMVLRLEQARIALAEDARVRTAVPDVPVQFSAGLDLWYLDGARSFADVFRSVDQLLYAAKRDGRNRTVSSVTD